MQRYLLSSVSVAVLALAAVPAGAQTANSTSEPAVIGGEPALDDIVITGRKRDERLLEAPLSIAAYTDEKLESLNLTNLTDISRITPGFKFDQSAFSNGFRLLSQIRFRGMVSLSPRPNNQVGAIFVDGSYVSAGSSSLTTDDVERIEVIKGPQNAYFGRNTFGGAVNFITRTPREELRVTGKAEYATYGSYDLGASVEGGLLPDLLTARLMFNAQRVGGQYDSGDGQKVGTQTTKSVSGTLYFTPGDRLKMRVRGSYTRNADYGNLLINYSGLDASCRVGNVPYYCGAIPHLGDTYTTYDGRQVKVTQAGFHQDMSLVPPALVAAGRPTALTDLLSGKTGRFSNISFYDDVPQIDHFGSASEAVRLTAIADYDIGGGYTVTASAGYGRFAANSLRDDDNALGYLSRRTPPTAASPQCAATLSPAAYQQCLLNNTTFLIVPFLARDVTAEVRLTSPVDSRLRVMIGFSYFKQWLDGNISGSGQSLIAGTGLVTPGVLSNNDRDRTFALGVFGSVSYDIFDTLTIDLEGRLQRDAARQFTQVNNPATATSPATVAGYDPVSTNFDDFLPRVILTWKPSRDTTIYGSWSIGALTGVANVSFNNQVNRIAAYAANPLGTTDPAEIRRILAGYLGYSGEVPEIVGAEKIDHFELGWKQSFLNGRGALSLAGYHIKWRNMKATAAAQVIDLDGDGLRDNIGPTLPAKSRIWGAEMTLDLQPVDGLALSVQGEVVNHQFTDFPLYGIAAQIAGNTSPLSANGRTLIQYPQYTLFASARYTQPIGDDRDAYIAIENTLTGKQFLDEANVSWIDPYDTVNLRAGFRFGEATVESYVTNLFDYSGPVGGRRNTLNDGTTGITIFPARRRVVGIRTSVAF